MPRRRDSHLSDLMRTELLFYRSFAGGMNSAAAPGEVAEGQYRRAVNFELDRNYGLPRVRDGVAEVCAVGEGDEAVDGLFALSADALLVSAGGNLYLAVGGEASAVGALSGDEPPAFALWGDEAHVLVASGGVLQVYDGETLETVRGTAAKFTAAFDGEDNDLVFRAVEKGPGGNDISVEFLDPGGTTAALSVTVTGKKISVSLARASSAISSTAAQVRDAILNVPAAAALISVELGVAVDGGGRVAALAETHLSGGTNAPEASLVFMTGGRVAVAKAGDSELKFSGVGELDNWDFDSGIDSDAISVEIGYQDGLSIVYAAPFGADVVVLKGSADGKAGAAYRLTGTYPDWAVVGVGKDTLPVSKFAGAFLHSSMLVLDWRGLRMAQVSAEAGGMVIGGSSPIDPDIAARTTADGALWGVPSRNQIWCRPGTTGDVYVYDIVASAWIGAFRFPFSVSAVATRERSTWIGGGDGKVYVMSALAETDAGAPIAAELEFAERAGTRSLLLKRIGVRARFDGEGGSGSLSVANVTLPVAASGGAGDIAALDTDIAALDTDPLVFSEATRFVRWVNVMSEAPAPVLRVETGRLVVYDVFLDVAEMGA